MLLRSTNVHKALVIFAVTSLAVLQSSAYAAAKSGPTNIPAFMTRAGADAKHPVLFESDLNTNAVYLLDANNIGAPPIGKITNGINSPVGLAVDKSGDLYVANTNGVSLFRPGALQPFPTISAVAGSSLVAVGADGTLAIAGVARFGGPGTLAIFDKGSPTPTRTITIDLNGGLIVHVFSLAIDAADNVYFSFNRYPRGGQLLKFPPGSIQGIDTGISPGFGEAFDAAGNFYVCYGGEISVWAPGAKAPFRRIADGLSQAALISVSPTGRLFAPNVAQFDYGRNQLIPGYILQYADGPNPIEMLKSNIDVNPVATAMRPAFP